MNPQNILEKGLEQHHYANTAYPLDGSKVWKKYKVRKENIDKAVLRQWEPVNELGLYIHIPFCEKRCSYCEYAVLSAEEADLKEEYINLLLKEIGLYNQINKGKIAVGLDIGGGTPTTIPVSQIEKILNATLKDYKLDESFSISIETTPKIAAENYGKIRGIRNLGIERISMGMQTLDPELLKEFKREGTAKQMTKAKDNIRKAGFQRFNIDLMYGFLNQSPKSFENTVRFAIALNPEYITLYRNRYKGTKLENQAQDVALQQVNALYDIAYNLLTNKGFQANTGKNTFSKIKGDPGTSAYLTKRVIEGTPYLGMGLGAQSLASQAIYYNQGAASKKLSGYTKLIEKGHFPIQDIYKLPTEEIIAKTICVGFYFGRIDKIAFEKKFNISLEEKFPEEVKFLVNNRLMEHNKGLFLLTKKGKDKINGIIPLFYSEKSKQNLMER